MSYYRDRYRVESSRLAGWDYSRPGVYLVTICTRRRERCLGWVEGGVMIRSPLGEIVAEEWVRTAAIRPTITLDAWVVMPDHIHGIVIIPSTAPSTASDDADDAARDMIVETPRRGVSTPSPPSPPSPSSGGGPAYLAPGANRFRDAGGHLVAGSVGAIVGQFKTACTRRIRAAGHPAFGWQPRFYDSILGSAVALDRARRYIATNPQRWRA